MHQILHLCYIWLNNIIPTDTYAYNDDPLTFYCQDNWWIPQGKQSTNLQAIGSGRTCPTNGEVPVGQTVDDSLKWADNLINDISSVLKDADDLLSQMKKIGKAQGYCRCDSKMDSPLAR